MHSPDHRTAPVSRRDVLKPAALPPLLALILLGGPLTVPAQEPLPLWYDLPADKWTDALP